MSVTTPVPGHAPGSEPGSAPDRPVDAAPADVSAEGSGVRIGLCTFPDAATADALARILVEERLAACVNLLPGVRSVYRWQGEVEQAEEVLGIIKTTETRLPALMERLRALHPYDCPELIALDAVAGLPGISGLGACVLRTHRRGRLTPPVCWPRHASRMQQRSFSLPRVPVARPRPASPSVTESRPRA